MNLIFAAGAGVVATVAVGKTGFAVDASTVPWIVGGVLVGLVVMLGVEARITKRRSTNGGWALSFERKVRRRAKSGQQTPNK
jgi:hypothetical protein